MIDHFDRRGRAYINDNLKVAFIEGALFPFSRLIANLCLLVVLYGGGQFVISNTITVGDFVAFITYLYMLTWPIMALGWVTTLFQRGITSLARLDHVFKAQSTLKEPESPLPLPENVTSLEIRNLTFHYPNHPQSILDDLTVRFSPA